MEAQRLSALMDFTAPAREDSEEAHLNSQPRSEKFALAASQKLKGSMSGTTTRPFSDQGPQEQAIEEQQHWDNRSF